MLSRLGFRRRLIVILLAFASVPAIVFATGLWATGAFAFSRIGMRAAWEEVSRSGASALERAQAAGVTGDARRSLERHVAGVRESEMRARQAEFIFGTQVPRLVVVLTLLSMLVLAFVALRVAGHLGRALSRPLHELVGWTELIAAGKPLPVSEPARGAPEFGTLRTRMREMADELAAARAQALEAERATAFRESARQVAHELKNPLTPIRFAVDQLRREAPPALAETVEVLAIESARLERMARSFAQFGRLPEGPSAPVDVEELIRATARTSIPPDIETIIEVSPALPLVPGHHEALARALGNVLLNAVDACGGTGAIHIRAQASTLRGVAAVEVAVTDSGPGIAADRITRIWEPYVTTKPGGTGLGLAIVRQTIAAHGGEVTAEPSRVAGLRGATIRFQLPADGVPVPPAALPPSVAPWPAS